MVGQLRASLKRHFVVPYAIYKTIICNSSYLHTSGWVASLRHGRPRSAQGNPIPWMNYSVVQFLEKRLHDQMRLFEYGSGYSTMFYARHVGQVTSVEYDQEWCRRLSPTLPENVDLIHQHRDLDGDYCRVILRDDTRYDVVVIDGADRNACIACAMDRLNDGGVMLLDDSSRSEYQPGFEAAARRGFRSLDFHGIKPTSSKSHQTTLFYRDGNCLNL